jgi:hypothetical protein
MSSELESILQGQLEGLELDSPGQWTLAAREALRKLSAFQLPEPEWWILKIVQAVVASGAPELSIQQTATDTVFVFEPGEEWRLTELQDAICSPELSPRPLDHLKRGLWAVCFNQRRAFHLQLRGGAESLVWKGEEPQRLVQRRPAARTTLTVSHRTYGEHQGDWLSRKLEAARLNAPLLETLRKYAYVCSIPLRVDGRRIDGLQAGPIYGYAPPSHPFFVAAAGPWSDGLVIPPGTYDGSCQAATSELQPSLRAAVAKSARPVQAAVVLHFLAQRGLGNENSSGWQRLTGPSRAIWVLDGVIIASQRLPIAPGVVNAGLFLPANGLKLDLSGFGVPGGDEAGSRLRSACREIRPWIERATLQLDTLISRAKWKGRAMGAAVAAGGLILTPVMLKCLLLVGTGGMIAVNAAESEKALEGTLQGELAHLRAEWGKLG